MPYRSLVLFILFAGLLGGCVMRPYSPVYAPYDGDPYYAPAVYPQTIVVRRPVYRGRPSYGYPTPYVRRAPGYQTYRPYIYRRPRPGIAAPFTPFHHHRH